MQKEANLIRRYKRRGGRLWRICVSEVDFDGTFQCRQRFLWFDTKRVQGLHPPFPPQPWWSPKSGARSILHSHQANYLEITEQYIGVCHSMQLLDSLRTIETQCPWMYHTKVGGIWQLWCQVVSGYGNTLGTLASWASSSDETWRWHRPFSSALAFQIWSFWGRPPIRCISASALRKSKTQCTRCVCSNSITSLVAENKTHTLGHCMHFIHSVSLKNVSGWDYVLFSLTFMNLVASVNYATSSGGPEE